WISLVHRGILNLITIRHHAYRLAVIMSRKDDSLDGLINSTGPLEEYEVARVLAPMVEALAYAQDTFGQRLVRSSASLSRAHHTHFGLLAQLGRALVRPDQRPPNQARHASQHPRAGTRHPPISGHL